MPEWTFPADFPATVTRRGRKMSGRLTIDVMDGQPICWVDGEIGVILAPALRDDVIGAYQAARSVADRQLGHQVAGDEPEP